MNKTQPMEHIEGYNVTKVNDTISIVQNERADSEEDRYYDERTLPDNGEWLQILRKNRQNGSKFTGLRNQLHLLVTWHII